jgi:hypothetical protein
MKKQRVWGAITFFKYVDLKTIIYIYIYITLTCVQHMLIYSKINLHLNGCSIGFGYWIEFKRPVHIYKQPFMVDFSNCRSKTQLTPNEILQYNILSIISISSWVVCPYSTLAILSHRQISLPLVKLAQTQLINQWNN